MAYIGNSPANVGNYQIIDDIKSQFDGTTTSFQLQVSAHNITPAKSGQLLVSINGVLQEPDDTGTQGFTISGTNIVFSSAPNTGAEFWGVYQGQNVDIGTPSFDTVDTVHIKDDAITDVKINSTTLDGKFNKSGDTMSGHIHFDTNDAYDIGSAEYKVRDLYVSDNSLWIGDTHKISIESGKMKFRKRKTSSVPTGISTAGGNSTAALLHASKGSLELMTSADWLSYRRTFNPDAKITDVFDAADFDDEDDIATVNGLQAALDAKLDDSQVLTNVPAGALFTDTNTETTTSISINANVLTYTDEVGVDTDIDLSLYIDDSNLARLTSSTIDSGTGIATFSRDDASTFTVDFSALLDDTILTDADIGAMGYIKTDNDTIYTHPATHPASMLTGALPAIDGSNLTGVDAVITQSTEPTGQSEGTLWLNSSTDILHIHDGSGFIAVYTPPSFISAVGPDGNPGVVDGVYKYHVFNSSKTGSNAFSVLDAGDPTTSNTIEYLIIAGGGGGGGLQYHGSYYGAGGAGAGGYRTATMTCPPVGYHNVTVGAGGSGGTTHSGRHDQRGSNGANSIFNGITSLGGGGGGDANANGNATGRSGGSGAGGGAQGNEGLGTSGQGNRGGGGGNYGGGGGGGATAAGTGCNSGGPHGCSVGGHGGSGTTSSITGSSVTRAGGGGGGGYNGGGGGNAGSGGGGTGGYNSHGNAGAANTGGGSGGAGYNPPYGNNTSGGSGVVIIRYRFQ